MIRAAFRQRVTRHANHDRRPRERFSCGFFCWPTFTPTGRPCKPSTRPSTIASFLGDLVDYGLEPTPCIDWVRQTATHAVRGNHDHGVAQFVAVQGKNGFKYLTRRHPASYAGTHHHRGPPISRHAADQQARDARRRRSFSSCMRRRDPLDEYSIADVDFWSRRLADVDAQVICVGHTHHPYILEVDDKLVINPGSVGQPRRRPARPTRSSKINASSSNASSTRSKTPSNRPGKQPARARQVPARRRLSHRRSRQARQWPTHE